MTGWANSQSYRSPRGWKAIRKRILTRDAGICYICGLDGANEVDHILNVAAGGGHNDENLAAIHAHPCHALKTKQEARANKKTPPLPTLPTTKRRKEAHPGLTAGN